MYMMFDEEAMSYAFEQRRRFTPDRFEVTPNCQIRVRYRLWTGILTRVSASYMLNMVLDNVIHT